jgi:hypothetical protein
MVEAEASVREAHVPVASSYAENAMKVPHGEM